MNEPAPAASPPPPAWRMIPAILLIIIAPIQFISGVALAILSLFNWGEMGVTIASDPGAASAFAFTPLRMVGIGLTLWSGAIGLWTARAWWRNEQQAGIIGGVVWLVCSALAKALGV